MQLPVSSPDEPGEIDTNHHFVASGTLDAGQFAYFSLGCGFNTACANAFTGIKAALYVEDPYRNSYWVPNFTLEIVDLCTASGVPEVIKAADGWNYIWKRIRVFDQWRFHGTCPWVRVGNADAINAVKFGVSAYMFGPGNPFWEHH